MTFPPPHLEALLVGRPHSDVGDGDVLDDLRQGLLGTEQAPVDLLAHHEGEELDARRRQNVVMLPGRHLYTQACVYLYGSVK